MTALNSAAKSIFDELHGSKSPVWSEAIDGDSDGDALRNRSHQREIQAELESVQTQPKSTETVAFPSTTEIIDDGGVTEQLTPAKVVNGDGSLSRRSTVSSSPPLQPKETHHTPTPPSKSEQNSSDSFSFSARRKRSQSSFETTRSRTAPESDLSRLPLRSSGDIGVDLDETTQEIVSSEIRSLESFR